MDARLEHLSWRVWHLKRKQEAVRRAHPAAAAARAARARAGAASSAAASDLDEDDLLSPAAPLSTGTRTTPAVSGFPTPRASADAGRAQGTAAAAAAALASLADLKLPGARRPPRVRIAAPGEEGSASASEAWLTGGYAGSPGASPLRGKPMTLETSRPESARPIPDPFAGRVDGLYIVLASMHGLVRGDAMELGRDPDTGGQVKYVVELARALSQHPAVYRVDLLTRLVADPKVDASYASPLECLVPPGDDGALGGAYIVRLPAGPPTRYLRKERLWPHVREFADRGVAHVKLTLAALADAGRPCELFALHGHYADAGEAAALMAHTLGADMVMTGHSLGRNKLEHLLASGTMNKAEVEATYRISRRVEAEERCLEAAVTVFTSTQQEVDDQWGLYHAYSAKVAAVLAARPRPGRHMPAMAVIPPGLDFSALKVALPDDPAAREMMAAPYGFGALMSPRGSGGGGGADAPPPPADGLAVEGAPPPAPNPSTLAPPMAIEDPPIWSEIFRFLRNPRKPAILAMSRPDPKKNLTTLVEAFAMNATLRQLANLVLVMGNRDTLDGLAPGSRAVVEAVFRLVDDHGLWGSVAMPKHHSQADVSDIYRLPLATRGAFVNVALQEPFGLTVIEAAAHGVPCVATKNGGPVDIMATLHHGLLVDPTDARAVGDALLAILTRSDSWDAMSASGLANIHAYSWPSHCTRYLATLDARKRAVAAAARARARLSGTWDVGVRGPSPSPSPRALGAHVGGGGSAGALGSLGGALSPSRGAPPRSPGPRVPDTLSDDEGRLRTAPPPLSLATALDDGAVPDASALARGASAAGGGARVSGDAGRPRGCGRATLVVVPLDGAHRAPAAAAVLRELAAAAARAAPGAAPGLGVASMLGFDATTSALRDAGLNVDALDFVVCNGGADIWHAHEGGGKADGAAASSLVRWVADDAWEAHIAFRWDRANLARFVSKALRPAEAGGAAGAPPPPPDAGVASLLRALDGLAPAALHPHHVLLELDAAAASSAVTRPPAAWGRSSLYGAPPPPRAPSDGGAAALDVVDRLRRRMRSNGYRCHMTLQAVPVEGEVGVGGGSARDALTARLHITPLRASRALALRFLSARWCVPMDDVTLVTAPSDVVVSSPSDGGRGAAAGSTDGPPPRAPSPAVAASDAAYGPVIDVAPHTSDLVELASGAGPVRVLLPAASPRALPPASSPLLHRLAFRIDPADFAGRVELAPESSLAAGLADAIVGKAPLGWAAGALGAWASAGGRGGAADAPPFRGLSSLEEPRGLDASVWKH